MSSNRDQCSKSYHTVLGIAVWGLIWFFTCVFFTLYPDSLVNLLMLQETPFADLIVSLILHPAFLGSLGSVVASFFDLTKYVLLKDATLDTVQSYLIKPVRGLAVGVLTGAIVYGFWYMVNLMPSSTPDAGNIEMNNFFIEGLALLLSFNAGYKEDRIFVTLRKLQNKFAERVFYRETEIEETSSQGVPLEGQYN